MTKKKTDVIGEIMSTDRLVDLKRDRDAILYNASCKKHAERLRGNIRSLQQQLSAIEERCSGRSSPATPIGELEEEIERITKSRAMEIQHEINNDPRIARLTNAVDNIIPRTLEMDEYYGGTEPPGELAPYLQNLAELFELEILMIDHYDSEPDSESPKLEHHFRFGVRDTDGRDPIENCEIEIDLSRPVKGKKRRFDKHGYRIYDNEDQWYDLEDTTYMIKTVYNTNGPGVYDIESRLKCKSFDTLQRDLSR